MMMLCLLNERYRDCFIESKSNILKSKAYKDIFVKHLTQVKYSREWNVVKLVENT